MERKVYGPGRYGIEASTQDRYEDHADNWWNAEGEEMSTEADIMRSFWRCESGEKHDWEYMGKTAQVYRCRGCQLRVTKAEMKQATDA